MHAVLFASDFDGTLSHGQEIDAQTLAAVSRFRQKGGRFGVCSGRDPGTLKDELSPVSYTHLRFEEIAFRRAAE